MSTSIYDSGEGSGWQKPSDYFIRRTKRGPLHGDRTDLTNATVNALKAGGFRAKGTICYGGGGTNKNSVRAWGQVLIGDNIYRVDHGGCLITPDNAPFEFEEYKPITDSNDPPSLSLWDVESQKRSVARLRHLLHAGLGGGDHYSHSHRLA